MSEKCIFCHPDREIILESEHSYAMMDKYPVSQGHMLIIPRRHEANYFNLIPAGKADLWALVDEAKTYLDNHYHPDGYNVGFNLDHAAGQTVFHVHIHVIPRYTGDVEDPEGGVRGVVPGKKRYRGEEKG
ncbi:MAG: HIT family protein [Bacteroidales bacterium]|nr:HIT family protein [Bacteroidales bacterium]